MQNLTKEEGEKKMGLREKCASDLRQIRGVLKRFCSVKLKGASKSTVCVILLVHLSVMHGWILALFLWLSLKTLNHITE